MDRVTAGTSGSVGATCVHGLSADFDARPLSLRTNFSWTLVGNVVYAGCQWGMLIILAKVGSSEMVGQFALGLAVAAPIMAFSMMALRAVQATDAKREYAFGDYFGLRLLTTALAITAISCIAHMVANRWETALVIMVTGLAAAPESISDVFYGLLQQRERMDRIAKSMLLKGPLMLASMAVAMLVTRNVCYAVVAIGVSRLLVLVFYDLPSAIWVVSKPNFRHDKNRQTLERIAPRWNWAVLSKLAWLTLPLGITVMLSALVGNIPRYFVEHELGIRELGVFAAIAYLMFVGTTLVRALGQSASPRLAQYYAAGRMSAYRRLLLRLVLIGAALGFAAVAIAAVAGRELLAFFYAPEYAENNAVFVWLMAAAGISYMASFLGYGMTAARYFKVQILMNCLTVGTAIAACWILVPQNGLQGAAVATVAASGIQLTVVALIVLHAMSRCEKKSPQCVIRSNREWKQPPIL